MGDLAKIFIGVCGVAFFFSVLYLLIKKKISEKNSISWMIGTFVILLLAVIPDTLDAIAYSIGIKYPPALLFLLSTLVLLYISLIQSIQISSLSEQLKELAQRYAILQNKISLKDNKREDPGIGR